MLDRVINYLKLSRDELKKVVWPSRQLTIQHTAMVVGISLGMAAFLGAIDYAFTKLLELVV
ncbi:MAG: preprotein translocase subunit SecE [Patescibacteria group bacterium]|nr:preprotein translocase subunit SecE [Patescibacteria group bacterium]